MGACPGEKVTVELQTKVTASDGSGGQVQTWTTQFSKDAVWSGITGYESRSAGQDTAFETERIHLDWDSDVATITTKFRVKLNSEIWQILRTYNPGRLNHHLEITMRKSTV